MTGDDMPDDPPPIPPLPVPGGGALMQFNRSMRIITHPDDPRQFVIGRGECGPFVGRVDPGGIFVHPDMFLVDPGPAGRRALEQLREEQEKDRREGVQYPDRCSPPIS
jgi:hypothetical protein